MVHGIEEATPNHMRYDAGQSTVTVPMREVVGFSVYGVFCWNNMQEASRAVCGFKIQGVFRKV